MKYEKIQGTMSKYNPEIEIREASVEEAFLVAGMIPELHSRYAINQWKEKLNDKKYLILIAFINDVPAGFKVGYDKWNDNRFYSWIGGVVPEFRRKGVALELLEEMEQHAFSTGYSVLEMKTYNHHKEMIFFALKHGFSIYAAKKDPKVDDIALYLRKEIQNR
ncbi:MAG: GNAT family N-acetyltransferase [Marinilabiliales bacterium]|nr:MAG: GNAT family N-acetyltransferase [Marinilabiliales bacterium]